MLDLLAGFIVELRNAGLPVSLTENLDAMEAIKHIPLEDRDAFKYALAATLVKNNAHWRSFETVFEVYFSLRGSQYRMGEGDDDALAQLLEELEQQEQMDGDGPRSGSGGGENMTPEEIAEMLYKALMKGDQGMMRAMARQHTDECCAPRIAPAPRGRADLGAGTATTPCFLEHRGCLQATSWYVIAGASSSGCRPRTGRRACARPRRSPRRGSRPRTEPGGRWSRGRT